MAVVRITDELKNIVLHHVSNQFNAAQAAAEKLRPEIGMDVYNIVLKTFLIETAKVDPAYFAKTDKLNIRVRSTVNGDLWEHWSLDDDMLVPYGLPKNEGAWDMGNYFNATVEIRNDPQFHEIYERINEWQGALVKVKEDRDAARFEVKRVLDSFTTLSPALKAWPALWDLLPEQYRNKHKEIVERTKAEPVKVDINTTHLENLTAKLVANKIMSKEKK